jgi:hypothetical protein
MKRTSNSIWLAMALIVLAHTAVAAVHGTAHTRAHVPLSAAATVFVFAVILAGPIIGLALTWWAERFGAWVVALTMAAALVFGVVNHFVLDSPDYVANVDPQSRSLFTITAVLLAITEALGFVLGIWAARSTAMISRTR